MFKCLPRLATVILGMGLALSLHQASANDPADHVRTRVKRELDALKTQGFSLADQAAIEKLDRGGTRRIVLRLSQGVTYALIGACDANCQHLELAIFDPAHQQLSRSTKRRDVAIFSGAPERTGLYEVEMTLPGCRQKACHSGFALLQQGGPSPSGGLIIANRGLGTSTGSIAAVAARTSVATPANEPQASSSKNSQASAIAAAAADPTLAISPREPGTPGEETVKPASVVKTQTAAVKPKLPQHSTPQRINMERRFGTEIEGANYRRLSNVSMSTCERSCVADARCRAVEYYNGNQSCGLFAGSRFLRRARGIDASVKRIVVP